MKKKKKYSRLTEMKIISWNVNGLRAVERKKELQLCIEKNDPDILFLQEIKGTADKFSKYLTDNPDYHTCYHSAEKAGYAGTGAWIKKSFVDDFQFITSMPNNPVTGEGRISRVDFIKDDIEYSLLGVYFPNGGKSAEAFESKLKFYDQFLMYVNQIRDQGKTVIWTGDINCAHNEIDLERDKENRNSIGFLPVERAWLDRVHEQVWCDVFRKLNPETVIYSWWDVFTKARDRNVGWRIDYFFVSTPDMGKVKNIEYLNDQMGSDHCPVLLEI